MKINQKIHKTEYSFSGDVWRSKGKAGWYFVSLPLELTETIREAHQVSEEGWGRLKTKARVGNYAWKTSIWFDKKNNTYLLPFKAEVRKKLDVAIGSTVAVKLFFEVDQRVFDLRDSFE